MWLPSLYITDDFGIPISNLTINDLSIYWYDLVTETSNSLPELNMIEDSSVIGLYRISGFPDIIVNENSEIVVKYNNSLVATLHRYFNKSATAGNIPVIITIKDTNGYVLSGVSIAVMDNTGKLVIDKLITNTKGVVELLLDVGVYNIYAYKLRYAFENPYTLNVVSPLTELTIVGNSISIISPVPDKVLLYGYILGIDGIPVPKTNIKVIVKPPLPKIAKGVLLSGFVSSTFTDKDGYFELTLLGGTTIEIDIPITGFKKTLVLPKTGVIDIADLQSI